jgi:molybdenum cofactor biosynthesis enzyme MoaA
MSEVCSLNPCAGIYGRCLDVKITDACNGHCAFCIEKGGRCVEQIVPIEDLIKQANTKKYDNILILGGEPLLSLNLVQFLKETKGPKYLTTNGSLLTVQKAKEIGPYLLGINISIHHFDLEINKQITGIALDKQLLISIIQALRNMDTRTRINCNLIKEGIDSLEKVKQMISFAKEIGADSIRFAELQNCPDQYIDARSIWKDLPQDAYSKGCEQKIVPSSIKTIVRLTCGLVNPLKIQPTNLEGRISSTEVLYSDGVIGSWTNGGCHGGCHGPPPDRGCH